MVGDLGTHDLRLLDHLVGKRALMSTRLVADDAERRLERMRQVTDMRSGPFDDIAVRLDQRIQLLLERLDFVGQLAFEALRIARADRGEIVTNGAQRQQAEAHLEEGRDDEAEPEQRERQDQHGGELGEIRVDLAGVARDCIRVKF